MPADIVLMNLLFHSLPMQRPLSRRAAAPSSSQMHSRVEVVPPELWPSSLSLRGRFRRWRDGLLRQAAPWLPASLRPVDRLARVKDEFRACLGDVPGVAAIDLAGRIERARSLRELWHLRTSLYGEVAVALSQGQAEQRLAQLNRHFPTRTPRSGLMPLDA